MFRAGNLRLLRARPAHHAGQAGFTFVEVLAAGAVLSAVVLCLVRAWTVFDLMSLDLQVRQKAVFVLNGETERLTALYTVGGFSDEGPDKLQSVSGGAYNAIPGINGSGNRLVYKADLKSAKSFTVKDYNALIDANSPDSTILVSGKDTTTQNFVWIDRARNIVGRLSWIACPISGVTASGSSTAAVCWGTSSATPSTSCLAYSKPKPSGSLNSDGASCHLLTLVLDYPYRALGSGVTDEALLPGVHLPSSTLTLSTIVGRWS